MFEAIFKSGRKSKSANPSVDGMLAELEQPSPLPAALDRDAYCKAIATSKNFTQLIGFLRHEKNWVQSAAEKQLTHLLKDEAQTPQLQSLLSADAHPVWLGLVAMHSKDNAARSQALQIIEDEFTLIAVAAGADFADSRFAAAEKVHSQAALQQLFRQVGDRDKNVRKYAQEKLAEIETLEMAKARAEQLLNELISLNGQPPFTFSSYPVGQVKQWWSQLPESVSAVKQAQFEEVLSALETRMQLEDASAQSESVKLRQDWIEQLKQLVAVAAEVKFCTIEYRNEFQAKREKIVADWEAQGQADVPDLLFKNLLAAYSHQLEKVGQYQQRFEQDCAEAEPCLALLERVKGYLLEPSSIKAREIRSLQTAWEQASKHGALVEPAVREEWSSLYHKLVEHQLTEQTKIDLVNAKLAELIISAEASLAEGNLSLAAQLMGQARREHGDLRGLGGDLDKAMQNRFLDAQQKIKELRKWEKWGTNKVREALCQRVEQLIGAEQKPQALEKTLKELREEWLELNQRHGQTSEKIWNRFNELCSQAFEPVKVFQQEQRDLRNANLEVRNALCEKLESLHQQTHWEKPDWKALMDELRQLDRQWSHLGQVDFRDRKAIQKRYQDARALFAEPIQKEIDKEVQRRQAAIDRIEQLGKEGQDLRAAMDEIRIVRQSWKPTVSTHREQEEKLWTAFNEVCSRIDNAFKEQRNQFSQQRKQQQDETQRILHDFELLASPSESEPKAAVKLGDKALRQQWQALKEEWRQLTESDRKPEPHIRQKVQQAEKQIERRLQQLGKNKFWDKLRELVSKADICTELENLALLAVTDDRAAQLAALQDAWDCAPPLDKQWDSGLTQRWQKAMSWLQGESVAPTSAELEKNVQQILQRCMEMEELAEIDSPAEFRQARMAFKIARLSSVMKQGGALDAQEKKAAFQQQVQAYAVRAPISPEAVAALQTRFAAIFEAMATK